MANEVFEMVHSGEARKGSKKSFACKSSKSKSFICLFLVSLLLVPNLSWSAQTIVRMAQPSTTLNCLSVYAARANGYFNDEGIARTRHRARRSRYCSDHQRER